MNTKQIYTALLGHLDVAVPNFHWKGSKYPSDLIWINSRRGVTEIEVKITKSDFKRDKKKSHQHNDPRITSLYYCVPKSMLDWTLKETKNSRAGIISVNSKYQVKFEKKASIRNNTKLKAKEWKLIARRLTIRLFNEYKKELARDGIIYPIEWNKINRFKKYASSRPKTK